MIKYKHKIKIRGVNLNKENIYNDLTKELKSSKVYIDEPMSKHTSFKIGGPADIFIVAKEVKDIKYVLEYANREQRSITVIGNGSNLLVKDKGIRGITMRNRFTRNYYTRNKSNSRSRSEIRYFRT